jgi:hypothetical protein
MNRCMKVVTLALAVMALVAAFSAATASAGTVICASPVTTCPANEVQPAGSYVTAISNPYTEFKGKFTLAAGNLNKVSCKSATIAFKSTAKSGVPLPGELSANVGTSGCTNMLAEPACSSVTFNNAPETAESTGSGGGSVSIGTEATPMTISFKCTNSYWGTVACTYSASKVPETLSPSGEDIVAKITEVTMSKVSQTEGPSEACNPTAKLNYVGAVVLGDGYFSNLPETVLCGGWEYLSNCPSSKVQPAGTSLVTLANTAVEPGVAKFTVKAAFANEISCKSAIVSHKTTAISGAPLPAELSTTFGLSGCATGGKEGTCTSITTNNAPETIEATGSGGGTVRIGTEASPMTFSFDCFNATYGEQQACTYKASNVVQTITPRTEEAPAVKISEVKLSKVSQTKGIVGCSTTATLNMVGKLEGEAYPSIN